MPTYNWTNPILSTGSADPFLFFAEGQYWLISTGKGSDHRHLPLWRSDDLKNWTFVRGAVERGQEGAWNRFNFWAPEILIHEGRYWLYYTAKSMKDKNNALNRVGLAVSDRPEGPYEDMGVIVDHASLDGSPFRDADGKLWLYYVTDHGNLRGHAPGKIWVDELLDPTRLADRAVLLISEHRWQEGPVMYTQANGQYRLTYSLGAWTDDTYRVAQALADRPNGPFIESEAIIMRSSNEVKGPGHHNFFIGPDGQRWLVYHGWDLAMTDRYARIDPIMVGKDGTLSSHAPSSTEQTHSW